MVVLGGEGCDVQDACTAGCLVVYVLDVPNLAWTCHTTTSEAKDASPGACALHFTTVRLSIGTAQSPFGLLVHHAVPCSLHGSTCCSILLLAA